MSIKQEFYKRLRECGICEDSARALEAKGLLTESICERYLIKVDFERLKSKKKMTVSAILSLLAKDYNKGEETIKTIVYRKDQIYLRRL